MKKNLFYLIGFWLITVNLNAQSCDGVPCIANPEIIQENLIECSQPALDSSQGQGTFCPEEEECLDVCENTSNTYSTAYNAGSTYSIEPSHDAWVNGDTAALAYEFHGLWSEKG